MKSQQEWFNEYAESHQHPTNQIIHYICVPAIYFSIVGMLTSIPTKFLTSTLDFSNPYLENWASLTLVILMVFYLRLSVKTFLLMAIFSIVSVYANIQLSFILPLFTTSAIIFSLSWIGQFYGHNLEGKKPSFFKDLQFLLIGPAWVFEKLSR